MYMCVLHACPVPEKVRNELCLIGFPRTGVMECGEPPCGCCESYILGFSAKEASAFNLRAIFPAPPEFLRQGILLNVELLYPTKLVGQCAPGLHLPPPQC